MARDAGFTNINIDIMHSLPSQTAADALFDLKSAISLQPEHLSWYQLTLEPNTAFAHRPPPLPNEKTQSHIDTLGHECLNEAGYTQYEVSAFAKPNHACIHNLNYWTYGDYLGIGAGAHSKITHLADNAIIRIRKHKHPKIYLNSKDNYTAETLYLDDNDLIFEFMLNTSRLYQPITFKHFCARTGLSHDFLLERLNIAKTRGLINLDDQQFEISPLGRRYLNDLQMCFLPSTSDEKKPVHSR